MYCAYHIQNTITAICISPHKCQCQRKLCIECLYNHGTDLKQTVPINIFQEMLIKKQKESKFYQTSELTQQRMDLKSIFSETESSMRKIWESLQESFKQIYDLIELQDKTFISTIYSKTDPTELSGAHLEILVQILEGNKLNQWNAEKNFYLSKLQRVKNLWVQESKALNEKIFKKMKEILSEEFKFNLYIKAEKEDQIQEKEAQIKADKEAKAFIKSLYLREILSNCLKKQICFLTNDKNYIIRIINYLKSINFQMLIFTRKSINLNFEGWKHFWRLIIY